MSDIAARLNEAKRAKLVHELGELMTRWGFGFDDLLEELAIEMEVQAKKEDHHGVKSCLQGAAEALHQASFDFYASTK